MIHLTEEELAALREKVKDKVIKTNCVFLRWEEFEKEIYGQEPPMIPEDTINQVSDKELV